MESRTLQGIVNTWGLADAKREYIVVTIPYGEAWHLFKAVPYSASKGKGEHRSISSGHAMKLRKEMEEGRFTPAPISVGLRPNQAAELRYEQTSQGRIVWLSVHPDDPLPLTDGGHRFEALRELRERAEKRLQAATTEVEREKAQSSLALVDQQPITAIIHLNSNTQKDFLRLQARKAVDSVQALSVAVAQGDDTDLKLAFDVAKRLSEQTQSSFRIFLRFDTLSDLPISAAYLCSQNPCDLGTSLVDLVRVGRGKDAEQLVNIVVAAFEALEKEAPELIGLGRVLTRPPQGSKGATRMLIGLAVCLTYRLKVAGVAVPQAEDLAQLVAAAREFLDIEARNDFRGPQERRLLGAFAREFFIDLHSVEKEEGIPMGLLQLLSPSAFGIMPLRREPDYIYQLD